MKISRETSIFIKTILDNYLPPVLRDSDFLMSFLYRFVYKKDFWRYLIFREKAWMMSNEEIAIWYDAVSKHNFHGDTDLNSMCVKKILHEIIGKSVLEISCGRGFLTRILCDRFEKVVAGDILIDKKIKKELSNVDFVECNIENLPFKNKSFDCVISTHTLEHVVNIEKAVSELRRVCLKRLIIVLPCERPYKFGFNFHLHFFPYSYFIRKLFGNYKKSKLFNLGGDWFYLEEY